MHTPSKFALRTVFAVAALSVATGSLSLHAQTTFMRSRVKVPFGFRAGSARYEAGTYVLSNSQDAILMIQGEKRSGMSMLSLEMDSAPSASSKAVFDRLGDQYFLREVWTKGKTEHLTFAESEAEHEARRSEQHDVRASVAKPNVVEVALLETSR